MDSFCIGYTLKQYPEYIKLDIKMITCTLMNVLGFVCGFHCFPAGQHCSVSPFA